MNPRSHVLTGHSWPTPRDTSARDTDALDTERDAS
jgi:hypothetical protein